MGAWAAGPGTGRCARVVLVATMLAFLSGARPVWAQEAGPGAAASQDQAAPTAGSDASGLSLEELLRVEVESVFGASKSLQKITEAPASVSVITADEIQRFGWRTLAEVLRTVRGFYVTDDRSYAFVGTRGFLRPGDYSTRMLVTLDGRRLNDNVFDQALIGDDFQVDLSAVERIEVIRGPASSLYGSSAFFGVINVITRTSTHGRTREATLDAGSLGLRGARVHGRHDFASGLGLAVTAVAQEQSGVRELYFPEYDLPGSSDGRARGLDGARRRSLFTRAEYRGWTLRGSYNERNKDVPTGAYGVLFNTPSTVSDRHAFGDVAWNGRLPFGWTGMVRGAFDAYAYTGDHRFDWDDGPAVDAVQYIDRAAGTWWTGEAQVSRPVGSRHALTAGLEWRRNARQDQWNFLVRDGQSLWGTAQDSLTTGVYVQDQVRLHRTLLVNLGVRLDHYSNFDDPVKPRIAAIYQPRDQTTVKMLYGAAFRAPSVFESHYEIPGLWRGRPDLEPESIHTLEGIVEHYAGRRLRLSGSVFHTDVRNLIDFSTDVDASGQYYFLNRAGIAHSSGIELEAEAKWPEGLQARVSYAYASASEEDTGVWLTNSPRHITQALLSVPLPRVWGGFVSMDLQALSGRESRTRAWVPAYVRPNMTLTMPLRDRRLRLTGTLSNLFNHRFVDPVSDDFAQDVVVQNGRTARLQLTVAF